MASRPQYPGPSSVRLTSRLRARVLALGADEVDRVNLDVPTVISTAMRVARLLRSMKQEVERRLPDFGLGVVDDLEVCAVALAQAHEHCRSSAATSSSDGAVVREMHRLHRRLRAELESLRGRGQLSLPNASRKRGRPSDAKRCAELESFCRLVRAHLALVLRKTDIAPVELTYAETLIESFRRRHPSAVDAREKQRVLRAKLFTLFVRDYDEIRRAVTYLRWRDAEMLAPPLHQVHGAPRAAAARPAATRSAARRSAASPTHPTRLRSFRK